MNEKAQKNLRKLIKVTEELEKEGLRVFYAYPFKQILIYKPSPENKSVSKIIGHINFKGEITIY